MRRAVCPGSFDPVTLGHLDVVERASRLFDEVVVAVGVNASKSRLFTPEERISMLERACGHLGNVRVDSFAGLLTAYCTDHDVAAVVKGLRGAGDFDYELAMAQMNGRLAPQVESVFLASSPEHSFVSSSLVKEVATFGGDVSAFVPGFVLDALTQRLADRSGPR